MVNIQISQQNLTEKQAPLGENQQSVRSRQTLRSEEAELSQLQETEKSSRETDLPLKHSL